MNPGAVIPDNDPRQSVVDSRLISESNQPFKATFVKYQEVNGELCFEIYVQDLRENDKNWIILKSSKDLQDFLNINIDFNDPQDILVYFEEALLNKLKDSRFEEDVAEFLKPQPSEEKSVLITSTKMTI